MDDADEGESDNDGDGAQWTVFLGAGVAAMRVDDSKLAWPSRVDDKQVT